MEEIRPNNLQLGKNYYIQMVGRFKNQYLETGRSIGIRFIRSIKFKEISILNEDSGKPFVKMYKYNFKNIHISISHSNDNAVALAIIENK